MTTKPGAIFDCDGTLLDSIPAWRGMEGYLCGLCGGQVTEDDRALLVTFTIEETARWFHKTQGLGKSVSHALTLMDEYLLAEYARAELLPGAAEFLEACARAGITMSVASSSPASYLKAGLDAAGVSEYFAAIVSVDDLGTTKREPLVYNHALELMGADKEATWGFEDSSYAMATLKRAGYKVVGVTGGGESASAELEGLGDLAPDVHIGNFTELELSRLWR